ncbi:hypothetical protein RJT34_17703 [Clitoria ternatea]|uniref:Uncharacterized protein n=1 Tax=Clitoria ternatea TaxID=43366 RepID=A0AAN9JAR5_CLITE
MANDQFSVISDSYCVPYYVDLRIDTKTGVTYDRNGQVHFSTEAPLWTLHHRRVLLGAGRNPVVTLYKERKLTHGRWNVFKGESNDSSQLLFTVKKSSKFQRGDLKLHVFLANNIDGNVCDFRVNVGCGKSLCDVYDGESQKIIAKMEKNDGFNVLILPNVDYAFIVALLLIIEEMHDYYDSTKAVAQGISQGLTLSMGVVQMINGGGI